MQMKSRSIAHMHTDIFTTLHIYDIYICVYIYILYVYICKYIYKHTCMCKYIYIYMYVHIYNVHICMHVHRFDRQIYACLDVYLPKSTYALTYSALNTEASCRTWGPELAAGVRPQRDLHQVPVLCPKEHTTGSYGKV